MKTCSAANLIYRWTARLSCLLLAFNTPLAAAAYTVIDDDLMPTAQVEQAAPPAHYTIPFYKEHSPIPQSGRSILDSLIPQMRNAAAIKIIGRPDARAYSQGKIADLANNRANNIRNYLARAGVPYGIIAVEIDNSPNPQNNGSIYPCDLYISTSAPAPAPIPTAATYRAPQYEYARPQTYAPMAIEIATPRPAQLSPAPAASTATNDQILRFINKAVQSGQLAIEVAMKLIRQLVESDNTAQPVAQTPTPYPAPTSNVLSNTLGLTLAPEPPKAAEWLLAADKTVKESMEGWATSNNYTLKWNAANPYHVGHASTLTGELLDVIDRVATSAGVVMSVSRKARTIYINDK